MGWQLAPVLDQIRGEVLARFPGATVGTIGQRSTPTDHEPDASGDVNAIDIMTGRGVNGDAIAAALVARAIAGDPGLRYVIWDRKIWSSTFGWKPRPYTGPDPHSGHVHVSSVDAAPAGRGGWLSGGVGGVLDKLNPFDDLAGFVEGLVDNAGRVLVVGAVLAAGGALVVLGLYRGVAAPAVARTREAIA